MNAFMSTPWGWLGWGLDWLAHSVLFNHGSYFTHSSSVADWGFPARRSPLLSPAAGKLAREGYRPGLGSRWLRAHLRPSRTRQPVYERSFQHPTQNYGDARTAEGFNRGFPQRSEASLRRLCPRSMPITTIRSPLGAAAVRRPSAPTFPHPHSSREDSSAGSRLRLGILRPVPGRITSAAPGWPIPTPRRPTARPRITTAAVSAGAQLDHSGGSAR